MKKTLLIISAVLAVLIGGLLIFFLVTGGMPKNGNEVFARFGLGGDAPTFTPEPQQEEEYEYAEDPATNTSKNRLRQLTTRPVAGALFMDSTIRFVERGTGHIYDIDTQGGNEVLVSGTTQPRTIRAVFSPSGNHVALMSEVGGVIETILGTLGSDADSGLMLTTLPGRSTEPGFSMDGDDFYFFVPEEDGGRGYAYTMSSDKTRELFLIPLTQVRITWGDPSYILTTPSGKAMGQLYSITEGGQLEYVTNGGRGLMAAHHASGTLVSSLSKEGKIVTRDSDTGKEVPLISLINEKCVMQGPKSAILVCGSPMSLPEGYTYPDDWYKGVVSFSDILLRVYKDDRSVGTLILSNLEEESGQPIDILTIGTNDDGTLTYFVNKYDNSLWLFDLTE